MKSVIEPILSLLCPCLHCGSFQAKKTALCSHCMSSINLFEAEQLFQYKEAPFDSFALYDWIPGESDILSKMFVALKGKSSSREWQHYAQRFVQKRLATLNNDRPIVIVPAPSSNGKKDHAYFWAIALAKNLGADLAPALVKGRKRHQRGASREQRRRVRIDRHENYSELLSKESTETLWIFADDILTTGATAFAAYEALGSPPHFETWVLGRRSLSCGASIDLL